MFYFSRAFTGLTSLATGIFFILLTTASIRATFVHFNNGASKNAAITLGTAFLLFLAGLFFALPTPRQKMIYATFSASARSVLILIALLFFSIVAALLAKSPNVESSPLVLGASQETILTALGVLFLAFLIAFLIPGTAYAELRALRRDIEARQPVHTAPQGRAATMAAEEDQRGLLTRFLGICFGLLAVAVIGSVIYGWRHAQFISSAAHVDEMKDNAIWLVLGFGLIILGSLYFGPRRKSMIRNQVLALVVPYVLLAPLAFFAIPAAQSGLPALLSLQKEGRYDSIQVRVVKQGPISTRRGCDRKATVVWEVDNRQLCNLPEHVWHGLEPGQMLELKGFLTDYGFRYEVVQRVP